MDPQWRTFSLPIKSCIPRNSYRRRETRYSHKLGIWQLSRGGPEGCNRVGAVAELEVLCLGEVLYQSLADGLGFTLRDVLIEVEHTTCHLDLGIGAEVGAGASDDILAVGVDDSGVERVIGCPLTDKPVEAMVPAGTGDIVAQQVVP